jgi:hypothetical protein
MVHLHLQLQWGNMSCGEACATPQKMAHYEEHNLPYCRIGHVDASFKDISLVYIRKWQILYIAADSSAVLTDTWYFLSRPDVSRTCMTGYASSHAS